MIVEIEGEPRPCCPAVVHFPEHFQADHIAEPIYGINKRSATWNQLLSKPHCGTCIRQGVLALLHSVFLSPEVLICTHIHILALITSLLHPSLTILSLGAQGLAPSFVFPISCPPFLCLTIRPVSLMSNIL